MELSLDIFKFAGRNVFVFLYDKGVCELDYDGYKYKTNNNEGWCSSDFPAWDEIQIKFTGKVEIEGDEFQEVNIGSYDSDFIGFCVARKDIDKLKDFCDNRNQKILLEKKVFVPILMKAYWI